MIPLTICRLNDSVCQVLTHAAEHVGNLKLIHGVWKFKAVGYERNGDIVPGGGPLTDRHNTTFSTLDEAVLNTVLLLG